MRKVKKLLAMSLALSLMLSLITGLSVSASSFGYPDMPVEASDAKIVSTLTEFGIINGTDNGTIEYNRLVTNSEAAKVFFMLNQVCNNSAVAGVRMTFTDIPSNAWYAEYVMSNALNGMYINWSTPDTFDANNAVSGKSIIDYLAHFVALNPNVVMNSSYINPIISSYSDSITRIELFRAVYTLLQQIKAVEAGQITTYDKTSVYYYGSWQYNKGSDVKTIPWDKITHLNHSFLTVSDGTDLWYGKQIAPEFSLAFIEEEMSYDTIPELEIDAGMGSDANAVNGGIFAVYREVSKLYPQLNFMISIGGWTRGQHFSPMAATAQNREIFIDSVIELLDREPWVDGIDLDWEYPGAPRDADADDPVDLGLIADEEADKDNFNALLAEIRSALVETGRADAPLTIALAASGWGCRGMDLPSVAKLVDFINIMSYDMHGAWNAAVGYHSGIHNTGSDWSIEQAVNHHLQFFAPEQINIGMAFYSRSFGGVEYKEDGNYVGAEYGTRNPAADVPAIEGTDLVGDPNSLFVRGSGNVGFGYYTEDMHKSTHYPELVGEPYGVYPYGAYFTSEIDSWVGDDRYIHGFDTDAKASWFYDTENKVFGSYDNAQSVSAKCDWVIEKGLRGTIAWEISGDMPNYTCVNAVADKFVTTPDFQLVK